MRGIPTLLRDTGRGLTLAALDLVAVGMWHPGLWAWRMEESLRHGFLGRAPHRFDARLRARAQGQPETAFVQGNTPWVMLSEATRWLRLGPQVTFVDAGAGDGMAAAVLSLLTGSRGYAVEPLVPLRTRAAAAYAALGVDVSVVERLEDVPLASCGAAYGAWTCVDGPARARLTSQLRAMPAGSRLVTVTHPVEDAAFARVDGASRVFPWGRNDVHVFERT